MFYRYYLDMHSIYYLLKEAALVLFFINTDQMNRKMSVCSTQSLMDKLNSSQKLAENENKMPCTANHIPQSLNDPP